MIVASLLSPAPMILQKEGFTYKARLVVSKFPISSSRPR